MAGEHGGSTRTNGSTRVNGGDEVVVERHEHVGLVTLNRPERLNALTADVFEALEAAWTDLGADPTIRAVVLTGAGRGFCAGADMVARSETLARGGRGLDQDRVMPRFTARHAGLFKPVVTAVNGVCAGAGLHFVVDCDICIASDRASFTDTHVDVGQITALEPIGLTRRIPFGAVTRMMVLGRHERLSAERAYELGMVSEVVPHDQLLERAMALGALAATGSPTTVQRSLRMVWESLDMGLDEALAKGWETVKAHYAHPDATEGPRAFAERRPPEWVDD